MVALGIHFFTGTQCTSTIVILKKADRHTVDREIFTLKIIRVKNFRVDKFSRLRPILEIFQLKIFYSRVKFSGLVSTVKLF